MRATRIIAAGEPGFCETQDGGQLGRSGSTGAQETLLELESSGLHSGVKNKTAIIILHSTFHIRNVAQNTWYSFVQISEHYQKCLQVVDANREAENLTKREVTLTKLTFQRFIQQVHSCFTTFTDGIKLLPHM